MSELVFTKVCERPGRYRIYELSIPVFKAPNKGFDFKTERNDLNKSLKDEHKYLTPNAIEYVAISDAVTHTERLMFLAAKKDDGSYVPLGGMQLDGKYTMMIHGGDERDVHPDKVYLRRLAKVNGFKFVMGDSND